MTTPLWLSESLRPFLCSYSMYICYLFLISSASVSSLLVLSFIMPILAWNVSLIFLKRYLVFPILFVFPISLQVHLRWSFYLSVLFSGTHHSVRYIFPFLPCLLLLFFPQLVVKPPQTTFLAFLFLWDDFGHWLLYNSSSVSIVHSVHSVYQI